MDNQYQSLGLNQQIDTCVKNSFQGKDWYLAKNTLLSEHRKKNLENEVYTYPAVLVNNNYVKGSLNKVNLFNEICTAFINKPNYCEAIVADDDPLNWNVDLQTGEFHYNLDDIQITFKNDNSLLNQIRVMKLWKLCVVLIIALILLTIIGLLVY